MSNAGTGLEKVAILIPAWRPNRTLVSIVSQLKQLGFSRVVVVNDGSGPDFDPIFEELQCVQLLRHESNRGKGAALKSGIDHALRTFPDLIGIVTADADGQHLPEDILRVAESLVEHPDSLILGARAFSGHVPLRSRLGNTVTRQLMRVFGGLTLKDTQTGLRGIPSGFARSLLKLPSNGYEFELAMLLHNSGEVIEQPIQTIYEPGNSSSHFKPLLDSVKICAVLLRLAAIVFAALALDYLVFVLALHNGAGILTAQILARAAAIICFALMPAVPPCRVGVRPALLSFTLTGLISYASIELLVNTGQLSIPIGKLAVEGFLFFVNLTLLRDWRPSSVPKPTWKTAPLWLLLLLPVAVEIYGFRSAHLMSFDPWLPEGIRHFSRFVSCALAATVIFGVFARRYFLPAAAAGVLICSIYAIGITPVTAVLLFVFSATILGRLLFGATLEGPLAMLAGTALWITAMSLTAHLRIHYAATYGIALAFPVILGFRHSRQLTSEWLAIFRPRLRLSPSEFLPTALLVFLLIANWLIVLKPEVSADGLAMHLAVPADIALHHVYTIDYHHFIWALMPMGADFCYTVVYLLGGEYAARLLNFAMLTGLALLLFRSTRAFVSVASAALLTALFLSSPMVYLLTGSMFVEHFVAFMTLGGAAALWRLQETESPADLMLTALLLGSAMALKAGALAVAVPCIVLMLVQFRRRKPLATIALVLALGLGSIPYAIAFWHTGDPFFPFQTGSFGSSAALKIDNQTYTQTLDWRTPFDVTFHTNRYFEGQPGTFGFQYLLFLPLLLGTLLATRSFRSRTAILLAGASLVVIVATQPNARYLYFITPLLTVGAASALAWLHTRDSRLFQAVTAVAAIAAIANIWFLPAADWYNRNFYTAPLFSDAGREDYLHQMAPIREAISWINRTHPDQPVVLADFSDIAGLIPPVYTNHWHDYSFIEAIDDAKEPEDVLSLFRHSGIKRMVINRERHKTIPQNPRHDPFGFLISACGDGEFTSGDVSSLRLRPDCDIRLLAARCSTGEPIVAGFSAAGSTIVDETDPRIRFQGPWAKSKDFPRTWNQTVTFSNVAKAQVCLTIEGTGFDYVYTRAFNRGLAQILVDARPAATVDLYSPTVEWKSKTTISGLQPGRHEVSILVLGRKSAAAADSYVDLDAVRIF